MNLKLLAVSKAITKQAFDCGKSELNNYLRYYALKNDKLNIGKTFVALDEHETLAGYITLLSAMIAASDLPKEERAKLPRYPIPAFRISRLAVDKKFQAKGVGAWLLRRALEKSVQVSKEVAVYAILVDAKDEIAASFYKKYGFISLAENPLILFLPLATILRAINS